MFPLSRRPPQRPILLLTILSLLSLVHPTLSQSTISLTTQPGLTTPLDAQYVGFSIEWTHIDDAIGLGYGASQGDDPRTSVIVTGLMDQLAQSVGGWPPHVRVGGNSATRLWWQGSTLPRNPWSLWAVNAMELQILEKFSETTGCKLTLTIPMLNPDPAYAVEFLVNGITRHISQSNIFAIEIGNEPDHYAKNVRRPASYAFPDFLAEYTSTHAAIVAALGTAFHFDYQGPAYAYQWTEQFLAPFMDAQRSTTRFISFHKYGMRGCSTLTNPDAVTPEIMMEDPSPDEYEWFTPLGKIAIANNQTLVWGEGGSSSCNGTQGSSDAYVSALWTVDMLFEMAFRESKHASISGAGQTWYAPYGIDDTVSRITVRPTYYGMLFVNRVLRGPGSQVFRAPLDGGWAMLGNATKTWGVANSVTGEVSVVIVRKDAGQVGGVTYSVGVPASVGGNTTGCGGSTQNVKGFVSRLECPGCGGAGGNAAMLRATIGLRVNGQSWDGTLDGTPSGNYTEEVVEVVNGAVSVVVQPLTAVVVRLGCTAGLVARQYTPPTVVFNGTFGDTGNGTAGNVPPTWGDAPGGPTSADGSQQQLVKPWYTHTGTIITMAVAGAVACVGAGLLAFTIMRNRRRRRCGSLPPAKLRAARAWASLSMSNGIAAKGAQQQQPDAHELTMMGVEDEDGVEDQDGFLARSHPHPFASRNPYLYRQGGEMV
ncbi:uncharacterized protein EV422DRAFT_81061 [Fimicolochytrium jonesii]|uniref:uncharacterized protein n=1 Tax=Fimicolochytrium jonesii TaxID=1396493 RepID=UPI0022FE9D24|nr:uncharacterized protein EV422DRAFT_81061 [Fimicolochytrium jonesii]KAI8820157.1 hypothetical protein EV422DRAFT_81061 [Fimicolochytrium jonesii]